MNAAMSMTTSPAGLRTRSGLAALPGLWVGTAIMLCILLVPDSAFAERPEEEPDFFRMSMRFMSELGRRGPRYDETFHYGLRGGWSSVLYWREFYLGDDELNLDAGAFMNVYGFSLDVYGVWADPFDHEERLNDPFYWQAEFSYLAQIDSTHLMIGARRNAFTGLPEDRGMPEYIDEVFLTVMKYQEPLQDTGNLISYINIHQRLIDDDGTLIDLGFRFLAFSQYGEWYLGDVVQLAAHITWNHKFLTDYGRFSAYSVSARSIKDISNLDNPGRGPWWLFMSATWNGGLASRVRDDAIFSVGLIFADFMG